MVIFIFNCKYIYKNSIQTSTTLFMPTFFTLNFTYISNEFYRFPYTFLYKLSEPGLLTQLQNWKSASEQLVHLSCFGISSWSGNKSTDCGAVNHSWVGNGCCLDRAGKLNSPVKLFVERRSTLFPTAVHTTTHSVTLYIQSYVHYYSVKYIYI